MAIDLPAREGFQRNFHDFFSITSLYSRRIALYLNDREVADADSQAFLPADGTGEPDRIVLRASEAEPLGGAGLFFRPTDHAAAHWYFYVRRHFDKESGRSDLMYVGRIPQDIDTRGFVTSAYLHILKRHPDEGGLEHYADLLEQKGSPRHQLLDILASSREARVLERFLVIVPAPSRFFPHAVASEDDLLDLVTVVLTE